MVFEGHTRKIFYRYFSKTEPYKKFSKHIERYGKDNKHIHNRNGNKEKILPSLSFFLFAIKHIIFFYHFWTYSISSVVKDVLRLYIGEHIFSNLDTYIFFIYAVYFFSINFGLILEDSQIYKYFWQVKKEKRKDF